MSDIPKYVDDIVLTELERLKLFFETHNWTQNRYRLDGEERCSYCLVGGLREVQGIDDINDVERSATHSFLSSYIKSIMGSWKGGLLVWNDEPERTKIDILNFIDGAIVLRMGSE